jgi:hypothetical protein
VQEALEGVLPEPIQEHFVVINGQRWPPKQVLAVVTGPISLPIRHAVR